ncbi:hypothetical protein CACET_c07420 [Clostridium aceticum]|uniref:Uncharacterized protein n=1 Tax=Clostridium aceticum TaxID=84022 RepID=A0A0D8I7U6_9CLOT|nr:hypothetical protein [Clostridium aceticum]AKL94252.1 hypothetical protein CACET_c07420 [Clostridium aceticum]KJF26102.1 hypothetical protein TZ02_14720 [Clostridium aceticum]
MSAFLGPIHHWLFKKIQLFEELEKDILTALSNEASKELIHQLSDTIQEKYGHFIPQEPLEKLIDTDNIHGWLQRQISIVETRQAAMIKILLDKFGKEALKTIENVYEEQGKQLGLEAFEEKKVSNATFLYKELNNYLLEGMPCDNANNVIDAQEEKVQWQITNCLHRPYWEHVGMEAETMYHLRFIWIKAFIEHANPNYTYIVDNTTSTQTSMHYIQLK